MWKRNKNEPKKQRGSLLIWILIKHTITRSKRRAPDSVLNNILKSFNLSKQARDPPRYETKRERARSVTQKLIFVKKKIVKFARCKCQLRPSLRGAAAARIYLFRFNTVHLTYTKRFKLFYNTANVRRFSYYFYCIMTLFPPDDKCERI